MNKNLSRKVINLISYNFFYLIKKEKAINFLVTWRKKNTKERNATTKDAKNKETRKKKLQ